MPTVDLHLAAAQLRAIVETLPPKTPAEHRLAGRFLEAAQIVELCADGER
ncbi:MAG: hypothetical protein F2754_10415 [Actinobacteria bacterium]|uniref:Unannotated protein n=1 Tax=freshwater metagenome TaxID=449393 RepID=A0A6J7ANI5_9ZZZZ|nr:hypothetical protein [Actinomycetota bacterium]MSW92833.1 hypothetical protein [Actinomycetota bacterium]MSX87789.1 hypothetical protein [Actinomycetota bacterium]MSY72646.1 hypothetical protein [Actinomycetota bacterium]